MKHIAKTLLTFISFILLIPILAIYFVQKRLFRTSERYYSDCAQFVSIIPGILGNYIRREYYKFTLKKCSGSCHIGFLTILAHPDAEIGEDVYIGINCMIGTCKIEDNVLIGSNVDILDGKKQHGIDRMDVPIRLQERKIERITIGKDSWLGNSSVVMANIGEGSVIGAGSVVVKDIESYSIAVGNPARVIKKRGE